MTCLDRRPTRTEDVSLTLYAAPCNQAHVYEGGSLRPPRAGNSTRTGREPRGQKKGRKRAENGGDERNASAISLCDIRMLGWLGNLDSNQD